MAAQLQYQARTAPILPPPASGATPANLEWFAPLSEPKAQRTYPHAVFSQSFVQPFPLIISVPQLPFGWFQPLAESPKHIKFQDNEHRYTLSPPVVNTGNSSLALSVYNHPEHKKQFFYQSKVEPPQPFAVAVSPLNFGWWADTNTPPKNLGLSVTMAGFMSGASVQQTPFTIPPVAGWFQQLNIPTKSKPFKPELYHNFQQAFFISAPIPAAPLGWLPQSNVPLKFVRPTQISSYLVEVWPPASVTFGWFTALAEPIKPTRFNQSSYTVYTDVGNAPAPIPSHAWFRPLTEPTKPRPIYHQFSEPVLARTNPDVIPSFAWFRQFNEPVFKKQIIMYMQTSAHTFIFFAIPADTGTMNVTLPLMSASMTGNVTTFGRVIRLPNEVRILIR